MFACSLLAADAGAWDRRQRDARIADAALRQSKLAKIRRRSLWHILWKLRSFLSLFTGPRK